MKIKRLNGKGFTIVELLIVIVVIGILAMIAFVSYGNVTRKARDTERAADTKAMMSTAEAYYASDATNAGTYPADCATLAAISGLNASSVHAPKGASGSNCATTAPSATSDVYQYTLSSTAGAPKLTITYWSEVSGATTTVTSSEKN